MKNFHRYNNSELEVMRNGKLFEVIMEVPHSLFELFLLNCPGQATLTLCIMIALAVSALHRFTITLPHIVITFTFSHIVRSARNGLHNVQNHSN